MVQTVTIPLAWANNIPGVSGIQDVQFRVPELSDIEDTVDDLTVDIPDIEEVVRDSLEQVVLPEIPDADDLEDLIEEAIADIPVPGIDVDRLIDDVVSGVVAEVPTLEGPGVNVDIDGVFGPLASDIQQGLLEAIEAIAGIPDELPEDLETLAQGINQALEDLEQLDVPTLEEIADAVGDPFEDVLEDLPGGDLLLEPDEFIDAQLDRVTDGLADADLLEDLQDTADELAEDVQEL